LREHPLSRHQNKFYSAGSYNLQQSNHSRARNSQAPTDFQQLPEQQQRNRKVFLNWIITWSINQCSVPLFDVVTCGLEYILIDFSRIGSSTLHTSVVEDIVVFLFNGKILSQKLNTTSSSFIIINARKYNANHCVVVYQSI